MKRIIIMGQGYQAFKAAGQAARLQPGAEILWIADQKPPEYPEFLLGLLLRSGLSPDRWPRARAGLKVDFEKQAKERSLTPQKVSRIRINSSQHEISFLSDRGPVSYAFDKIICMAPTKIKRPPEALETDYIWPDDRALAVLTGEWDFLDHPLIIGPDPGLVQVFARWGKTCTWLRQGSFLDDQLQFFTDQRLKERGIQVLSFPKGKESDMQDVLSGGDFSHVFRAGETEIDADQLKTWGLEPECTHNEPFAPQGEDIFILPPLSGQHGGQVSNNPETALGETLKAVGAVLSGQDYEPPRLRTGLWNLGDFSVARVEKYQPDTQQGETVPAVLHGLHSQDPQKPYALCVRVDPESRHLVRFECAGFHAAGLAARAASFMACGAPASEMQHGAELWTEHEINPLLRCAEIIEKKMDQTILGITPDELRQSKENQADFFLLDVRSRIEFEACRLPGASNIPLKELKKRVMEIPRFTPIVLYSQCSGRAYSAAAMLRGMGARQLYVLDGGIGLYTLSLDDSPIEDAGPQPVGSVSG